MATMKNSNFSTNATTTPQIMSSDLPRYTKSNTKCPKCKQNLIIRTEGEDDGWKIVYCPCGHTHYMELGI